MTTVAAPALEARDALSRLIAKVAKGDRNALQSIYNKTSAKLFGVILRILPTRDEAEEILQDVYLTVWLKAPQFDQERGSPITWLATIARNKAIDRRRSLRSYGEELSDTLTDSIPDGGRRGRAIAGPLFQTSRRLKGPAFPIGFRQSRHGFALARKLRSSGAAIPPAKPWFSWPLRSDGFILSSAGRWRRQCPAT
ncbi:MAG: hypothetical protein JWM36_3046 [Hyphomicrobiales bacterium]|nr:hypothetical protein [Hyphomicrobiales bacterium]